ncbi:MAG: late competence development ComFB family protein [SAR324 cluster bacterium]|nr:late competence development ComFB family protein [SAR324 cluster bacterium]
MHQIKSLDGISFDKIRNQNESRVKAMMLDVLKEFDNYYPTKIDLEDIYALTLNKLPARYIQAEGFTLEEDITEEEICENLRSAIKRVSQSPTVDHDDDSLLLEDDEAV